MPLAFAPFYLWPLAILLPAVLLWLLRGEISLRQVFVSGFLFGLGYLGFGIYWIYNSLYDFGQAAPPVASGLTGLLIVYLALYPAATLTAWVYARCAFGLTANWLLPVLWFGFEWLKGWVITGMPWLSIGYSQTSSPLAGYAPLVGVYGIGALCLLMAVALVKLLRERHYPMAGLLLAIPLIGWWLQQVDWTEPTESLQVTMVQGNIPQEIKWRGDQQQQIFNTYWRETNAHWDSDLIVWPETAVPGDSGSVGQTLLQPMQQVATEQDAAILTGIVVSEDQGKKFYNSVILLGAETGVYHKRHLVMFGEYYPMRWLLDLFRDWILIPYSDLTPGPAEQPPIRFRGNTFGISICFEDVFSRDVFLDLPGANLLVNVSNDAWFGDSTAPHQHLQIAQMRSLEAERTMLRSTNTGVSAFIDHKGIVLRQSEQFKTESITTVVEGRDGVTPFYYFLRLQGPLAIVSILTILLLAHRRRLKSLS